jgi:hypothetical protein
MKASLASGEVFSIATKVLRHKVVNFQVLNALCLLVFVAKDFQT